MAKPQARRRKPAPELRAGLFFEEKASVPAWVLGLPILLFAVYMSFRDTACLDTGFHVATGEWILQHHSIPRTDPFSHTASGQPWIAHEWLFGVIAYLVFQASGIAGLIGMKALLVAFLLVLTAWVARLRGAGPGWTALVLAASYAIAYPRFQERPEIVSLPIAVAFLLVYEKSAGDRRLLLFLPLLQLLWINIHGGTALLGWALAGGFLAERMWRLRTPGSLTGLAAAPWELAAFLGVVLASFVNPNFTQALTYGLLRTRSPLQIDEFHSLRQALQAEVTLGTAIFLAWSVLLLLFFAARRSSVRLYEWILFPALLAVCAIFFRFNSLFAFLLAPTLAAQLSEWKLSGHLRWWIPALISAALLARVAAVETEKYTYRRGAGVFEGILPVRASEFIKANDLQGRMFNSYNHGGYLIWQLWPERQVFIDGREDVYVKAGVIDEYLGAFDSRENWELLVARHGIDYAVLNYPVEVPPSPDSSLDRLAFDRSSWALVFMDDAATVYVRRNGRNDEVIRRHEIKTIQPFQLSVYLSDILADPARNSLFQSEVQAVLRQGPDCFRLHFLLGMYAIKRGPAFLDEAAREFQRTAEINPEYVPAHLNLAGIYVNRGQSEDARKEYRKALDLDPGNAMAQQQLQSLGR
jgi:hypothetical protein